jgi:very-short-patch-repair endonuclease
MPLTATMYVQRFNVAVSRARDQLWLFHSVGLDQLHNPEDMRFQLLDYCYGFRDRATADDERIIGAPVREDMIVPPFQSRFEQRVCNRVSGRGFSVVPQYPALGYSIDLVVVGPQARLAVECDGDYWHGPEAHQRDMARQRELERYGWKFARVMESDFIRDPAAAMEPVWEALEELEIYASGWTPPAEAEPQLEPVSEDLPPEPPRPSAADYVTFTGTLPSVMRSSRKQLFGAVVAIVAAEGPVLGDRLHRAFTENSPDREGDPEIANILNSTIFAAVRDGLLIEEDPLGEVGVKPHTFRLPDQDPVRVRQAGPRSFGQIPPSELAAVMHDIGEEIGWGDDEAIFDATAARYGREHVGTTARERLRAVLLQAMPDLSRDSAVDRGGHIPQMRVHPTSF